MLCFDRWNVTGWTGNDVWPYYVAVENYTGLPEVGIHNTNGPIKISAPNVTPTLVTVSVTSLSSSILSQIRNSTVLLLAITLSAETTTPVLLRKDGTQEYGICVMLSEILVLLRKFFYCCVFICIYAALVHWCPPSNQIATSAWPLGALLRRLYSIYSIIILLVVLSIYSIF